MPPIAQHGTTVVSLQSCSSSGRRSILCRGLGHAREECAKGDIVGASLGGGDGAVAAGTAGHPDDTIWTQQPARLGVGHVLLTDMHPVALKLGGKIGAVVHDERDVVVLGDRLQDPCGAADGAVVHFLQAQLQAGDITAGKSLF